MNSISFVSILNMKGNKANKDKYPLTPMGSLLPGLRTQDPLLGPIDVSRDFAAHVSLESPSNISPNPSEVISEVSEP